MRYLIPRRQRSRPLIFGTTSSIARYATVSDTGPLHGHQMASGNPPPPFHNPYPYPTHPKPTPHQIFHLAPGATQKEIKERCTFFPRLFFFLF